MSQSYNRYSGRSLDGLTSLADGVFAIAMTLLVLDLRLPPATLPDSRALLRQLVELGPSLAAYLLSFTLLGTFWLALHAVLDLCAESDRNLAWAVLAFLFFIATLPFTAAVLAAHVHLRLSVVLYWLDLLGLGITLAWAIVRAGSRRDDSADREGLILVRRRLIFAQALYAAAAAIVIVDPVASIIAFAVAQLFFMISPRIHLRI